jgi:hypothetical protein
MRNMRKQGNATPPKVNVILKDSNDSGVGEISGKEFKRMIIRTINEIRENISECILRE